jgi:hypothetical protein
MAGKTCSNDCVKQLSEYVTLFDDFDKLVLPANVTNMIAVLRSIEKAHPLLLDTVTELRSLATAFRFACIYEGEKRRKLRLEVLRDLRSLLAAVINHDNPR